MPRPTGTSQAKPKSKSSSKPGPKPGSGRLDALIVQTARQLGRDEMPTMTAEDRAWFESDPALAGALLQATIDAAQAGGDGGNLLEACCWLLRIQLELIRLHMEAGHEWAASLLESYQQLLIDLGRSGALDARNWNAMAELLQGAKIPVRPEMALALAEARPGFVRNDPKDPMADMSPEALMVQLRGIVDQMGDDTDDPFEIVEGMIEVGATMPPKFRVLMVGAFGRSSRQVMRETLPLWLLDAEPDVRAAAAAALEEAARPEAFSPLMLRRTTLVRDWAPPNERDAIDRAIRRADQAGVACAAPPREKPSKVGGPVILCSMIDGGGAQSVVLASPGRGKGLFAGLLLKQEYGVRDAWRLPAAPRREIDRMLAHMRQEMPMAPIGRETLDLLAGHFIAVGAKAGRPPAPATIGIAEALGAGWKDCGFDPAAEAVRLFESLEADARAEPAVAQALRRAADWIDDHPDMQSWYVDDPALRAVAVASASRPTALRRVLRDVLPPLRAIWTERALVMALWLQAGGAAARQYGSWQDCATLAYALATGRKMEDIPAMTLIARRSLSVARNRLAG